MNPKRHLEYYSRLYPSAWKQVDQMRNDRGKKLPFWPTWCFLPLAGAYAIISAEANSQGINITHPDNIYLFNDIGILGALAAWRITQGVYRFDPDVYREVIDTPITGSLPYDIFFNMPEWCIYIESPDLKFFGKPLYGFFAYLEYDINNSRKELRLVLDFTEPENSTPKLVPQVIHLGDWSLLESIEKAYQEARHMAATNKTSFGSEVPKALQNEFAPLISLILYICSTNGEISSNDGKRQPTYPKPKKTKKRKVCVYSRRRKWPCGTLVSGWAQRSGKPKPPKKSGKLKSPKRQTSEAVPGLMYDVHIGTGIG